jgi:hypothetical protein
MMPAEKWEQTDVHKASSYFCGRCGKRFASPHLLYDHLDEKHPKRKEPRRERGA